MEMLTLVKEVASAASTQARFANRYWLVMVGFGLITLTPRSGDENTVSNLPWIGKLAPEVFSIMALVIFSLLTIAFASAHGQQIRAVKLAHRIIDSAKGTIFETDPKDLYDAMRRPSLIRVSPLPQLLQGSSQFFGDNLSLSKFRQGFTTGYYLFLKVISIAAYVVLPMAGLVMTYHQFAIQTTGLWILISGSLLAFFSMGSLIVVLYYEGIELVTTALHIARLRGEPRGR